MDDRERFDGRLTDAVRAYADHARTQVDAAATAQFDLQSRVSSDRTEAWEWGDIELSNGGGTWDGSCGGGRGGWNSGGRAEVSCWLTGQGAYDGLTYFQHLSAATSQGWLYGLILPVPPPTL
jgi:hypothetical protein